MFANLSIRRKLVLAALLPLVALFLLLLLIVPVLFSVKVGGPNYVAAKDMQQLSLLTSSPSLLAERANGAMNRTYIAKWGIDQKLGQAATQNNLNEAVADVDSALKDYRAAQVSWTAKLSKNASLNVKLTEALKLSDDMFAFYQSEYSPALNSNNQGQATAVLEKINSIYGRHRAAMNDVAVLAAKAQKARENEASGTANTRIAFVVVGAILAMVGAAAVSRWVAKGLLAPIVDLTARASHSAEVELPDLVSAVATLAPGQEPPTVTPFPVHGNDEFAELSKALNTMRETSVNLAVNQARTRQGVAQTMVNLGRRNQGLLSRTLAFITELEQNERNPETLSHLFRLDHLTTRMRRNAESLLVLAGAEPPRTWSESVAIADVIRASLSEIESYERVDLGSLDFARVKGTVVSDVAHLAAELMENATNFSPPSTRVVVTGHATPEGYVLRIVDNGIGMTTEEIFDANHRLASPQSLESAPSKVLGHYVVSHLAARHGIRVQLLPTHSSSGVTVEMLLPVEVVDLRTPAPPQGVQPQMAPGHPAQAQPRNAPPISVASPGSASMPTANYAGQPMPQVGQQGAHQNYAPGPVEVYSPSGPPQPVANLPQRAAPNVGPGALPTRNPAAQQHQQPHQHQDVSAPGPVETVVSAEAGGGGGRGLMRRVRGARVPERERTEVDETRDMFEARAGQLQAEQIRKQAAVRSHELQHVSVLREVELDRSRELEAEAREIERMRQEEVAMQEASQRAAGATAMMQARQAAEARIAQELAEQQAEQHGEQQRRIDDAAATAVADEPEALDARAQARQDWREQAEQDAAVLRQMSAGEEVTFELHAEAHGAVVEVPPVPAPSARSIETSTPVAPAPLTALPTRRPGTSWDEPTPLVEIEDSSSPEEVRSSLSGFQNSFRRGVADAAGQPASFPAESFPVASFPVESFPVASAPVPPFPEHEPSTPSALASQPAVRAASVGSPPPPPPPVMTDAGFPQRQKGTSWVDLPPLAEESDAPDLDPEAVKSALNSFQSGWQQHKPTAPPPPPSEFGATGLPTRRPGAGLGNTNTNFVEDTSEERDADDVRSALGAFQGAKHRDSVEYNQPPQDKDM
jgi:HAMP domain